MANKLPNLKNVYYFGKDNNLTEWKNCDSIEKSYWTAVFENLDTQFEIMVTENPKYLPKYGDNILVILKSDEFASDIKYIDKVKAVFRNYFDEKYSVRNNIFFLPLPYLGELSDNSIIPITQRSTDVFFAGQVTYPERKRLSKIILELKNKYKDINFIFKENDGFFSSWNVNQYLSKLGDSKISLCPGGASRETYRHFESLHQGCVVVSEPLPYTWYFNDVPIITVQSWEDLSGLLENLINNENLLQKTSTKSMEYWNQKLSPTAVADFIKDSLNMIT